MCSISQKNPRNRKIIDQIENLESRMSDKTNHKKQHIHESLV